MCSARCVEIFASDSYWSQRNGTAPPPRPKHLAILLRCGCGSLLCPSCWWAHYLLRNHIRQPPSPKPTEKFNGEIGEYLRKRGLIKETPAVSAAGVVQTDLLRSERKTAE